MEPSVHTRTATDSVALTFDDGPSPWTGPVLEELARVQARATFFVSAGTGSDLVRRISDEGHEVGYHCREHVRHGERDEDDVRGEASADLSWLSGLGIEPRAWRPPWGDLAPWSAALAAELGMEVWLWSDDTHDWTGRGAPEMLEELDRGVGSGTVVLMHDGIGPGALRSDTLATIALIAPLVRLCRARGLEPGLLDAREAVDA